MIKQLHREAMRFSVRILRPLLQSGSQLDLEARSLIIATFMASQSEQTNSPKLVKVLGVSALALLVSSVCLTLQSLESSVWFSFSNNQGDYKLKLLGCDDCPGDRDAWSTDCYMAQSCDLNSGSDWCSRWTKSDGAGKVVYYMDYIAVLSSLLVLERVVFMVLNRYVGIKLVSYILSAIPAALQTTATLQWFAATGASFTRSCSNEDDELEFCAEAGAVINICATCLSCLGCAAAALFVRFSSLPGPILFKIEGRRTFLLLKVVPVLLTVLFFEVFSLNWHWSYYENTEKHYNFMTYAERFRHFDNFGLNCVTGSSCGSEFTTTSTSRNCKAFERLFQAGELLRKIKLAEFVFAALWVEGIGYTCTGQEFGLPVLQYLWPIWMILTQVIGLVVWVSKSGSSFTNNCLVVPLDTDIDFCSDTSVIFSIIGIVINIISVLSFVLVYFNRFDFKAKIFDYDEKSIAQRQFAVDNKEKDEGVFNQTLSKSPVRLLPLFSKRQTPSSASEEKPLSKRARHPDEECSLCRKR
jgi:hypothetical protein